MNNRNMLAIALMMATTGAFAAGGSLTGSLGIGGDSGSGSAALSVDGSVEGLSEEELKEKADAAKAKAAAKQEASVDAAAEKKAAMKEAAAEKKAAMEAKREEMKAKREAAKAEREAKAAEDAAARAEAKAKMKEDLEAKKKALKDMGNVKVDASVEAGASAE